MDFSGHKALVTGAAGGIGAALVTRLRAAGAKVAVADCDVGGIEADAYLPGNLLDAGYADALPKRAVDALGGLSIVVNNAGVITRGSITETSDADWSLSIGVNVEAPFRICRAAIPIMAVGGGAIVNIGSCWGLRPSGWIRPISRRKASGSDIAAMKSRFRSVSIQPGATVLQRMPSAPWSTATARVNPCSPAFVAQ